jgi:hypothetical protein
MKEFKDDQGRPWLVSLTVSSAARVKDLVRVVPPPKTADEPPPTEAVPFDLIDAGDIARTFQVLRSNFLAVGETLYAILRPAVEAKGLSREDFLDGLRGESLEAGANAIEEELIGFFPPRLRGVVQSLSTRMAELTAALTTQAEAALKSDLPTPGASSGSVPGLSEHTPESSPSAS